MGIKILDGHVKKQKETYVLLDENEVLYEFPSSEDKNSLLAIAHQQKKRVRLALGEDGTLFHLKVEGGGKQRDDIEWLTERVPFPKGRESKFKPSYVIAILSLLTLASLTQASISIVRTDFIDPGGWGAIIGALLGSGVALYNNFNKRGREEEEDSLSSYEATIKGGLTSFIVKVGCCFEDELLPAAQAAFETDYNDKVFRDAYNTVYSKFIEESRLGVLRLHNLDKVMLYDMKSRLDRQSFFLALERNESTPSPTEELVDNVYKQYEKAATTS